MHHFLYLICFTSLAAWFYNKNDDAKRPIIGKLFLVAFGSYLTHAVFISTYSSWLSTPAYVLLLFVVGFFINSFSAHAFSFFTLYILLVSFYTYFNTNLFSGVTLHRSEETVIPLNHPVDEHAEFIIALRSNEKLPSIQHLSINTTRLSSVLKSASDSYVWYAIDVAEDHDNAYYFNQIKNIESVEYIEWNEQVACPVINDPIVANRSTNLNHSRLNDPMIAQMWHADELDYFGFHESIGQVQAKKKIRIGIIDTGVDGKHEDLIASYRSIDSKSDQDPLGHGTHCAGIIAATTNNQMGIASLSAKNMVEISSIQVFDRMGFTSQAKIIKAIYMAVDKGMDVLSMSLGGPSNDQSQRAYQSAIDYANTHQVIVVAAAGNENICASKRVPAGIDGLICVGALDTSMQKASFSNTLDRVQYGIWAPGVGILSTLPNNKYGKQSGTSMATPLVASMVALIKCVKPNIQVDEVYRLLSYGPDRQAGQETKKNQLRPIHIVKNLIEPSNIWQ